MDKENLLTDYLRDRIDTERKRQGITIEYLCEVTGISKSTYNKSFRHNERRPSGHTLSILCRELGIVLFDAIDLRKDMVFLLHQFLEKGEDRPSTNEEILNFVNEYIEGKEVINA